MSAMARLCSIAILLLSASSFAQATIVEDPATKEQLVGEHVFNLQWIDTPPGTARVEDRGGGDLYLSAEQREEKKGNYAVIKGKVVKISKQSFTVEGEIVTRVDYLNSGKPCARSGTWTFRVTGKRPYWRLKEMQNVCEGDNTVDYLDIYVAQRREAPQSK